MGGRRGVGMVYADDLDLVLSSCGVEVLEFPMEGLCDAERGASGEGSELGSIYGAHDRGIGGG